MSGVLRVLVILALAFLSSDAHAIIAEKSALLAKWEHAFSARMKVLTKHHSVSFGECAPRVRFGLPDDSPSEMKNSVLAMYDPTSRTFHINHMTVGREIPATIAENTRLEQPRRSTLTNATAREIIDHELAHCLADEISRTSGESWYSPARFSAMSKFEWWGNYILSEGIAMYFEATSTGATVGSAGLFPDSYHHIAWSHPDMLYVLGEWIVHPIIKHHGERGIRYLVTTPFTFPQDYNVRSAAFLYQATALRALAQPK